MKSGLDRRHGSLERLQADVARLRAAVEESRPGSSRQHDVEDLESRAADLATRWKNVHEQVEER